MNNNVRKAVEAVDHANQIASRLALADITDATTNCAVAADNAEFLTAINAAQLAVEAAMDEVDGAALTELDFAAAAVACARMHYYRPARTNRKDAAAETQNAYRRILAGSRQA